MGFPSTKARSWEEVSSDATAFIAALLQKDLTQRLTALEALEHPWLKDLAPNASEPERIERISRLGDFSGAGVQHIKHTIWRFYGLNLLIVVFLRFLLG